MRLAMRAFFIFNFPFFTKNLFCKNKMSLLKWKDLNLALMWIAKKGYLEFFEKYKNILSIESNQDEVFWFHHKLKFLRDLEGELFPVTWHPDRFWDWCLDEDEKREIKQRWY